IPVINKTDLPNAEVEKTKKELVDFLGVNENEIIDISAKTGKNVDIVLDRIVTEIPAPKPLESNELKALIFDSYFDTHKGVVSFVRIFSGEASKGKKMNLAIGRTSFEATEVGIFTPDLISRPLLTPGDIGYIVTNLKD